MTSELLFSNLENLLITHEELKRQVSLGAEKLQFLKDENAWLREQINELRRGQFGSRSERWESQEQMSFLNEAELESTNPDEKSDEVSHEVKVSGYTKRVRGHREPLLKNLTREIIKIELPLAEQVSAEGLPLKVIGWEISEKLKYTPAQISVVEYHRAKYGVDSGDYVKTAKPLPSLIPQGIATPELLAAIIIGKYGDGLPLYRMEEIFGRHGIELSRGSMARWVIKVAAACRPIWNILAERLHESFYVAVDETSVQVLKETGRKAEAKSWMWVRSTPFGPQKIILFDYTTNRDGDIAQNLFLDYRGFLQSDGLNIYEKTQNENVIRIGCNMHGRRGFEKAKVDGAKSGQSLGEEGLVFYKKLYDLEEEIRGKDPDEKYKIRNEMAKPIWDQMKSWNDENIKKVPKKSKIGQAVHYFANQYELLIGYLQDGRLEIDNGFTERAIRKFAIGRNNWMFSDTPEGADASSLLYSLVVTAKVNKVNLYKALVKIFTDLPMAEDLEHYERLAEVILSPALTA